MTEKPKTRSAPDPGLVVVDKPAGMTSHDVVSRVRRAFGTKKVGHAGTLDPMATGVLILGIERGTKLLGHLSLGTKSYAATIRLGSSTTTDDAGGEVSREAPVGAVSAVDDDAVAAGIGALTGEIDQVPSAVSAVKIDGRRAYQRVRDGEDVDIPARRVTVSRFDVRGRRPGRGHLDLDVEVDCSSGTYIRALARDLGDGLGVGGHLTALRRTSVGPFTLGGARTLEQLAEAPTLSFDLDRAAVTSFPVRAISAEEAEGLRHGRWLEAVGDEGVVAARAPDGHVAALLSESGRRASPVLVFRPAGL